MRLGEISEKLRLPKHLVQTDYSMANSCCFGEPDRFSDFVLARSAAPMARRASAIISSIVTCPFVAAAIFEIVLRRGIDFPSSNRPIVVCATPAFRLKRKTFDESSARNSVRFMPSDAQY